MAKRQSKVVYKQKAAISISLFAFYIENKGYPITATRFNNNLYEFGNSLANFPNKYPVCRKASWAKRNLRCAVFKKNYIFIYKLLEDELVVFNVVHASSIV